MKELRCPSCGAPYSINGICSYCGNISNLSKKELKKLKEELKEKTRVDENQLSKIEEQAKARNFMIKRKERLVCRRFYAIAVAVFTVLLKASIYFIEDTYYMANYDRIRTVLECVAYISILGIPGSIAGVLSAQIELNGDSRKKYKRDLKRLNNGESISYIE